MQTTRSIVLGVAAAALLAGCGSAASSSSSSAPAGSQSGSAAAAAPASQAAGGTTAVSCSLAPSDLVSSALGVTGLTALTETASGGGAACVYSATGNIVSLSMFSDATTAKMTTEQQTMAKTEQVKAYPGLGDEAFTGTLSAGKTLPSSNTLVARKGSVEIMIVSTASVAAEKSLAEQLFTKIG